MIATMGNVGRGVYICQRLYVVCAENDPPRVNDRLYHINFGTGKLERITANAQTVLSLVSVDDYDRDAFGPLLTTHDLGGVASNGHTVCHWRRDEPKDRIKTPDECAALLAEATEAERARRADRAEKERRAGLERDRARAEFLAVRPAWAKAVIVAEFHRDTSDIQSDYFGSVVEKVVALAWSRHTRDLFAEMRKAADRFPETADLGTDKGRFLPRVVLAADIQSGGRYYYKGERSHWHGELHQDDHGEPVWFTTRTAAEAWIAEKGEPEQINFQGPDGQYIPVPFSWDIAETEIEHREKYSMGQGYYLADNRRSGWRVCKEPLRGPDSWVQCDLSRIK